MSMNGLSQLEQKHSLVHLYVGDGKGKTTAAVGLAVRFCGNGGSVLFTQYLKGRDTAEIEALRRLGVVVSRAKCGSKFVFQMTEEEKQEARDNCCASCSETAEAAATGKYGLIVLDEVVDAVNCGLVDTDKLLELIRNRHPDTEIVLTGRNPNQQIVDVSDYYTEFVARKHPYEKGVAARAGIEF